MLVQVVGEAPLRRETRTTEANKQRDFLSTPGSSSQEEADGPTTSHSSKRKRLEQDRGSTKKRKVCEVWGPHSSGAVAMFPSPSSPTDIVLGLQWKYHLPMTQGNPVSCFPLPQFWLTRRPQTILHNWHISSSVSIVICLNQFSHTDEGRSTVLLSLTTFNHCVVHEPKVDHHTSVLLS